MPSVPYTRDAQRRADLLAGLRREIKHEGGKAKVPGRHNIDGRDQTTTDDRQGKRIMHSETAESRLGNGMAGIRPEEGAETTRKGKSVEGLRALGMRSTSLSVREPAHTRFVKRQCHNNERTPSVESQPRRVRRQAPIPIRTEVTKRHKAPTPQPSTTENPRPRSSSLGSIRHLTSAELNNRSTSRKGRSDSRPDSGSLTAHDLTSPRTPSRIFSSSIYAASPGQRCLTPGGRRFAETPTPSRTNILAHSDEGGPRTPTSRRARSPLSLAEIGSDVLGNPAGKRCSSPQMRVQASGAQMTSILPHSGGAQERSRRGRAYLGNAPPFSPEPLTHTRSPTGRKQVSDNFSDIHNIKPVGFGRSSDPFLGHHSRTGGVFADGSPARTGKILQPQRVPTDPITHKHTVI